MKTTNKWPDGEGYHAIVTTSGGAVLIVDLWRSGQRWHSRVSGRNWSHDALAKRNASAQGLVRSAIEARRHLTEKQRKAHLTGAFAPLTEADDV